MELFERIRTLADASGVSGNETEAALTALEMLREFCPDAVYENGNVIGHLGVREPGKPHVLIDAHIDQIGICFLNVGGDFYIILVAIQRERTKLIGKKIR